MQLGDMGTIAASVGGGGVSVGAVIWYLLRSLITDLKQQVAAMRTEVTHLRDRELADISRRLAKVEDVEANCPGVRLGEKMDNALGWLKKLDLKLDGISGETAEQRADIKAKALYIANLDAGQQRIGAELHNHLADRRAHGNG